MSTNTELLTDSLWFNCSPLIVVPTRVSHGDPLDQIAGDAPATPVVDLGGAGVGVAGQVLDILKRHVLAEQVRDHQDAEGVGREDLRQPGRLAAGA